MLIPKLFLMLSLLGLQPQRWKELEHDKKITFSYDVTRISRYKNTVICWIKTVPDADTLDAFRRAQSIIYKDAIKAGRVKPNGYDNYTWTIEQIELKCDTKRFKILYHCDYAGAELVFDYDSSLDDHWMPIIPESLGEYIFNQLCSNPTEK